MRVLLLSNGHGEDLSGALLAEQLRELGAAVAAMPLVGHGEPYRQRGVPLVGSTLEISTGGLGYTNRGGQLREIWEGQLSHLLRQLLRLRRQRRQHDLVVAVGDVVPVLGAWLSGRPCAAYLVAYSSHYEGRLRLPWPLGWLLRRPRMLAVWSRDALTSRDLSGQLGRPVSFVGNPFFDLVARPAGQPQAPGLAATSPHTTSDQRVLLLPGSRLPEAGRNLQLLLRLLEQLEIQKPAHSGSLTLSAALVPAITPALVQQLGGEAGWQLSADGQQLRHGRCCLALRWGRFASLLQQADLVVSMAGTASEQAVGLGLPVVQLAGGGPQFTAGFAEAQRRLLGPGVVCDPGAPGALSTLAGTAALILELLARLHGGSASSGLRQQLNDLAAERIGPAGGSRRMAAALLDAASQSGGHG